MKKLVLITFLLLSYFLNAQQSVIDAFSESYTNETNKEYQKAIDNILLLNTKSYSINLRLGWLYYLNGDFNKSKTYYQNAIQLAPKSIEAKFGLVYPIATMLNWDEVIVVYNDILKINPKNTSANYRLAYIYFLRKDWTKVENYLQNVLQLYPFDYDSNLLLGSTYIKNGKIKEAKKVLQSALEFNPQSKDVIELLKGL